MPSVASPVLAAPTADGVDSSTQRFLASLMAEAKKTWEEKQRKQEEADLEGEELTHTPVSQHALPPRWRLVGLHAAEVKRRRKKKKRRRRTRRRWCSHSNASNVAVGPYSWVQDW